MIIRKGGKALKAKRINRVILVIILHLSINATAQLNQADTSMLRNYPFINSAADTIINSKSLFPFFARLQELKDGDSTQVSIVHIGDSHLQADMLTREVRKDLQLEFGNAGRGLIFPHRLARSNEPNDFRSSSNRAWLSARINSPARFPEPGVSGVSIQSGENGVYIDINTFNHDSLNYAFDLVTLLHTKDSLQYDFRISDSTIRESYLMSSTFGEPGGCATPLQFNQLTSHVRIKAEQCDVRQNNITVNGIILQNSSPGILYHVIGVNGAHFNDYNNSPLFYRQLPVLKPDLVIISLGTNEGANARLNEEELIRSVTDMIDSIKKVNLQACILIVTPSDDYFHKKYKNQYLRIVHEALLKSADSKNVACLDIYAITGGYGSCSSWRKYAMMQKDGVHYNRLGYTLQGYLIYKALNTSYLEYAADRLR